MTCFKNSGKPRFTLHRDHIRTCARAYLRKPKKYIYTLAKGAFTIKSAAHFVASDFALDPRFHKPLLSVLVLGTLAYVALSCVLHD